MKIAAGVGGVFTAKKELRGLIQAYQLADGTWVVAKWPRKRGTPKSAYQIALCKSFAEAGRWSRSCDPEATDYWYAGSKGSPYLPRDLAQMAYYGTFCSFLMDDGTEYVSTRMQISSIQDFLNLFSQAPGTLIVRDASQWVSLVPGPAGTVLTSLGENQPPDYIAPSSGAGGQSYEAGWKLPNISNFVLRHDSPKPSSLVLGSKAAILSAPLTLTNTSDIAMWDEPLATAGPTGRQVTARIFCDRLRYFAMGSGIYVADTTAGFALSVFKAGGTDGFAIQKTTIGSQAGTSLFLYTCYATDFWIRISIIGTNVTVYLSADGFNWFELYTATLASLGMSNVNRAGLLVNPYGRDGAAQSVNAQTTTGCPSWDNTGI